MAEDGKTKIKIGIIGVGVLGDASKSYYEDNGYDVFCYDKFKKVDGAIGIGSVADINQADAVFICVPTPRQADNSCDTSVVDEAIGYVTGGKIIIIRSTVPPFTTDKLQKKYPRHKILFNPEFLTERRAHTDFRSPKLQIIGYTPKSENIAIEIIKLLPPARFSKIMPAPTAEMFKYVRNCYLATKNSFFNQIYNLCRQTGVDYNFIKECAEADPWIGPEHLDPNQDGYKGFNGKCLPKDSEAFLKWAKDNGIEMSILEEVVKYNSALLASQNIKKDS